MWASGKQNKREQSHTCFKIVSIYTCAILISRLVSFPHRTHVYPPSPYSIAIPSDQHASSSHPEQDRLNPVQCGIFHNTTKSDPLLTWSPPSIIHSLQVKDMFCIYMFIFPYPQVIRSSQVAVFVYFDLTNTLIRGLVQGLERGGWISHYQIMYPGSRENGWVCQGKLTGS